MDPRKIRFGYAARGKPFLDNHPDWHFNLSHSKTLMLCAVTKAGPSVWMLSRSGTSTTPPASRKLFFCEHEARALELLPKPLSTGAFFECRARKEAFLKPTGEGLSRNLSSVAVTFFLPRSVPRFERIQDPDDDPTAWSLRSFIPAENYTAAVALRAPISELRLHLSGFEK